MASFDENGKYIKTNWKAGDKITATKLNKIEESIEAVNDNDISRHVEADSRLDALEAKDVAHDKEFTNVKNTIANNKAAAELGDYEINSRMTFLEQELNEGIEEVHNVASTVDGKIAAAEANMNNIANTVDGKIAAAETNMQNQVNQCKADMEAMVAEVEGELDGIYSKYNYVDSRDFTSLQQAVDYAGETNKELYIYNECFITEGLQINYNMTIRFILGAKIYANAVMDNMIYLNADVKLYDAVIDGSNLATNVINISADNSELYNCVLMNCLGDAVYGYDIAGKVIIQNCTATQTNRGFMLYGNAEKTSTIIFNENKTMNINNLLYYFDTHDAVYVNGGDFTGSSESGVNCGYKCNAVYVNGGKYYDILRGATLGKRVYKGYVKNTVSINCSYAGISVDTKEEDGSYVESQILVMDNISERCGYAVRLASKGSILYNNTSMNHTDSHAFYVNEGSAIIGNNTAIGGKIYCFNNADIRFNYNFSSGETVPIQTSGNTNVIDKNIQKMNSAGNIEPLSDIVICDVINGGYAIKLPRYTKITGRVYKIIKKNDITKTLAINTLDGSTINGESIVNLDNGVERIEITWDGSEWITL